MAELTEYECEVIVEFIEMNLIDAIKADGIDSFQYLHALLGVWRKCGGTYDGETGVLSWVPKEHGFLCPECNIEIFVDDIDGYKFCPNCGRRRRKDGEE